MTTPYIVTFEVTAKVLLEVPVNAPDDTEAIADAHAAIAQGFRGKLELIEYASEDARFDSLRVAQGVVKAEAPDSEATSQGDAAGQKPVGVLPYTNDMSLVQIPPCGVLLRLFSNDPQVLPAASCETLEPTNASTLAVLVRSMLEGVSSLKGYLEIAEKTSGKVLQAIRAERGGWEVTQTLGDKVARKTWLSREDAYLEAAKLRLVDSSAAVAVYDFTDRSRGPTHLISIR